MHGRDTLLASFGPAGKARRQDGSGQGCSPSILPETRGAFLKEEEEGVKKAEKGEKEPEENDRWTRISQQGRPESS